MKTTLSSKFPVFITKVRGKLIFHDTVINEELKVKSEIPSSINLLYTVYL
ncbi:MAG: hypothetical protein WCH34_11265 [Bacteroidota bacterium]